MITITTIDTPQSEIELYYVASVEIKQGKALGVHR